MLSASEAVEIIGRCMRGSLARRRLPGAHVFHLFFLQTSKKEHFFFVFNLFLTFLFDFLLNSERLFDIFLPSLFASFRFYDVAKFREFGAERGSKSVGRSASFYFPESHSWEARRIFEKFIKI